MSGEIGPGAEVAVYMGGKGEVRRTLVQEAVGDVETPPDAPY